MRRFTLAITIISALLLMGCSTKNIESRLIYPEPEPDSIALPFLPGIVSSDSLDFNASFSPDGNSFYFARSFKGKWQILETVFDGKHWSAPSLAKFSEPEYSMADPFITSDGSVYFISNRPRDKNDTIPDYDIWAVHPEENGQWSAPENIQEVNSDSTEYFVSLAANGNLYFASNRPGGYGSHDIYVSKFVNGKYTTPVNLGSNINSSEMEHDPLILNNEKVILFTSVNRENGFGEADFHYATRETADQAWTAAINLGHRFNTPTYEYCPYITPDLKFFFYSSEYDVKWISTENLPFKLK
jgi:hypothetical protein